MKKEDDTELYYKFKDFERFINDNNIAIIILIIFILLDIRFSDYNKAKIELQKRDIKF